MGRSRSVVKVVGPPLFDLETGQLQLLLYPYYLERLYGPGQKGEAVHQKESTDELPFPLLNPVEEATVICLRGQRPSDLATPFEWRKAGGVGRDSWWSWAAYAATPWGWCAWATPFFRDEELVGVKLHRWGTDDAFNYRTILTALVKELSEPHDTKPVSKGIWPFRTPEDKRDRAIWEFSWGTVRLYYEVRDRTPEVYVGWK